jgi:hypothetical protein
VLLFRGIVKKDKQSPGDKITGGTLPSGKGLAAHHGVNGDEDGHAVDIRHAANGDRIGEILDLILRGGEGHSGRPTLQS